MTKESTPKKLTPKKSPSKKSLKKSSPGEEILGGDKAEILSRLFDGEERASFTQLLMSRRKISGPLPSADEFAGYGKVLDSAPADIIKMAKEQQRGRIICSYIVTSPDWLAFFFAFLAFVLLIFFPAPVWAWVTPPAFLGAAVGLRFAIKK